MTRFACAAIVTFAIFGVATAADVTVTGIITRVEKKGEGDKVEYTVTYRTFPKKKGDKVEPVAKVVARNCVVAKGKLNGNDAKKIDKGDAIENGLANMVFPTKDDNKGSLVVRITVDEEKDAITQILVLPVSPKKS